MMAQLNEKPVEKPESAKPESRPEAKTTPSKPAPEVTPASVESKRVDPDDGKAYTLKELESKYKDLFSAAEVLEYWTDDCTPAAVATSASHPAAEPAKTSLDETAKTAVTDETKAATVTASEAPPLDAQGLSFSGLLKQVDPSGGCDRYLKDIEDNFDSVEQIAELYASAEGASQKLDPQLFDDLGVEDEAHRELFAKHFEGILAAEPAKSVPVEKSAEAAKPTKVLSMADWLRLVDPSGGCNSYLKDLEENYDGVDQIEELYVVANGAKRSLDPQFFDDLGIENTSHKALFTKHFEGGGTTVSIASVATEADKIDKKQAPDKQLVSNGTCKEVSPFADFLKHVDPTGGCDGYLKAYERSSTRCFSRTWVSKTRTTRLSSSGTLMAMRLQQLRHRLRHLATSTPRRPQKSLQISLCKRQSPKMCWAWHVGSNRWTRVVLVIAT